MICSYCGQQAQMYQIHRRQQAKAQRPRPSIRGTIKYKGRYVTISQASKGQRWEIFGVKSCPLF